MFGFVERFIAAKILDISRDHWLGDQVALEALVRFCDEELKHQELFRRIEGMISQGMPGDYTFSWNPNEVADEILSHSTWAVMALIFEVELFTQEHYKQSIEPDESLSELFKDIFLYHWKEEAHHSSLDELEWPRLNKKISDSERDQAVDEVIGLVGAVDVILQTQSLDDADYFLKTLGQAFTEEEIRRIRSCLLQAYRWQYMFAGVEHPRFQACLGSMLSEEQQGRLAEALRPLAPSI